MVIRRPLSAADVGTGPFVAGCTALQLSWRDRQSGIDRPPENLTDITHLPGMRGISDEGGILRIGALETLEACRCDIRVRQHAPMLSEACGVIAALGVRLLATIGGNIGWRQGDSVPALLALGAVVETVGGHVALAKLLDLDPMPLVLAIHVPRQPKIAVFEKVGHRAAFSTSVFTVAACANPATSKVRLAAGGGGNPGRRLRRAEATLTQRFDRGALASIVSDEVDWGPGVVAGQVLAGLLFEAFAS